MVSNVRERGAVDPHWRLLEYVDRTTDLVGVVDDHSRVVYLNEAARKRLGVAVDAQLTTADLFPPDAFARYYDEIRPALLRTSTWSGELPVFTASGDAIPMSLCLVGGVGPGGEIAWLVTHGRELSRADGPAATSMPTAVDTLAHEIAVAVSHGQIVPYVETVVDLPAATRVGIQGLARWHHPLRGVVNAADFVDAIAAHPTAPVIDLAVLRAAARTAAQSPDPARMRVYGSCSPALLSDPHLERFVGEIASAARLATSHLYLAVRPVVLAQPETGAADALRSLRDLGCRLVLSDVDGAFDIDLLTSFGFDELRLSREVVARLDHDQSARRIAAGTVGAAHAIGITVTAVGVETTRQHELVVAAGCDHAIGAHYGAPDRAAP